MYFLNGYSKFILPLHNFCSYATFPVVGDTLRRSLLQNCLYCVDSFKKAKFSTSNSFSILHLNVHSIERHIDEIQVLLDHLKFNFDVLCFSESKIVNGTLPKTNINLEGYQEPIGMPTKATKGGFLMYIENGISFVPRKDLDICKDKKLESCFVELVSIIHCFG